MARASLLTRRADLVALLGALAAPLLLLPILVQPSLGIALVAGLPALLLATRSVAYPLALSGVPALVIGFLGANPFPPGFVFFFVTGWLALAVAVALAQDVSLRALQPAALPIGLTVGLALLMLARLEPGAYPMEKFQLFLSQAPLVLLAGVLVGRNSRWFRIYLFLWLLIAIAHALLLLKGLVGQDVYNYASDRVTTAETFNPIGAGRQAAYGILVATFLVLAARSSWERGIAAAGLPLLAIALLASGSRGPVLALTIGLVLLIALVPGTRENRKRMLGIVAAAAATFVLVPTVVPASSLERATSILTGSEAGLSSNGRTALWEEAWQLYVEHPLAGAGTGSFAIVEPVVQYPHNIVLEAASELGTVGALLVVALIVVGFKTTTRFFRESSGFARAEAALMIAMFCSALVNSMLSDSFGSSSRLWLVIGLACGLRARYARTAPLPAPASALREAKPPTLPGGREPWPAHARPSPT